MRPTILYSFAFTEFLPLALPTFFPVNVLRCAEKKAHSEQEEVHCPRTSTQPMFSSLSFKEKILGNGKAHF